MAKVSGPLFSMEASGSYGGALVFAKWKGRQYVRELVTPANPHSANQEEVRNQLRVSGAIQKWVNTTTLMESGQTKTDKERLIAATPGGFAWNGWLIENCIGKGGMTYSAALAAYAALTAPQKSAWDAAALALSPAIAAVYQTQAGGTAGTPLTGGEVFFIYRYGLNQAGLAATPTGTPPTYA
ncbi:MAG: hypothetical protein RKO25_03875 [Candidatus Contendobacter sp.]|nr:hypothetical protein [Candidatus Contendobacter sp.]